MKKLLCQLCLIVLYCITIYGQSTVMTEPTAADRGYAAENFRYGVQALYNGSFNDAILQFETALSYLPEEGLILDWLGKAYYRAGIEGAALEQWQLALDLGYGGILLENHIEIVKSRRITDDILQSVRFIESGLFPGETGETFHFSQPLSVLPLNDGTMWVIAYGSNEILRLDVNGQIEIRSRGPLNGFDRPMDMVQQANGNLLVSEYAGDRISQLDAQGNFITYFGSKGRGDGQLLGPQYLAQDSSGNIYVTDYGNGRITVFSAEGEALFSFGDFISPSGITIINDLVYIADTVLGNISIYDTAGNYIDILLEDGTLFQPEALRDWENYILVADTNRVLAVDSRTGSIYETARTGSAPVRLTSADVDVNGNIIATDFQNSDILVLTRMTELVGGFFVQIERVYADEFPRVIVEVSVENYSPKAVIGLKDINFLLTEEKRPVAEQQLIGVADSNNFADITILIDRSTQSAEYAQVIDTAVREIATAMDGQGTLRIVSEGREPLTEYSGEPFAMQQFTSKNLRTPLTAAPPLDLAIRLAANDLINGSPKRAIVYLTTGGAKSNSLARYNLTEITSYLNNNSIPFFTVNLDGQDLAPEIDYITNKTLGKEFYVFRPQGLTPIIKDILAIPVGVYQFSYTSSLPTNFGATFLPIEVEVYLMNRSGRDETGYFAPLQ